VIDASELANYVDYDPATGSFLRKKYKNQYKPGTDAGSLNNKGYVQVCIAGTPYKAHRVAWAIMTGEWPIYEIDHKNGQRGDNRWENLRHATKSQNQGNARKRSDNTSGFKGVWRHKEKWRSVVFKDRRKYHIGLFDTPEEAHAAYVKKATELHGEFACAG
jgi:HNH endonuclease/AP2 domain